MEERGSKKHKLSIV